MSYPPDVKEKAFQLFVQGASFDEIHVETKVNKKTLIKWKKNEGWIARRDEILSEVKDKNNEQAVAILSELYKGAVDLYREVKEDLREVSNFRTKEGGVAAYIQLTNLILKLHPPKKELKVGDVLSRVLKVLFDHPKIGLVLDKYKDEIVNTINKELQKDEPKSNASGDAA